MLRVLEVWEVVLLDNRQSVEVGARYGIMAAVETLRYCHSFGHTGWIKKTFVG